MSRAVSYKPNLSSAALFFGLAIILILMAVIIVIAPAILHPEVNFGSCRVLVDVARTDQQKAQGLSGRATIADSYGMVFPFNHEQPYFWMKGMLSSIDIVWLAGNKVVAINPNLPTDDGATQYQAPEPIDWVLEVGAGRAAACGVKTGSVVTGLRS